MSIHTRLTFFFLFTFITGSIACRNYQSKKHSIHTKLFVFGDSYADTGNWPKANGGSWKEPYGSTYPGKPSGRFSNGRVLTDYVGVFNTLAVHEPNMTTQIDHFQNLVEENVYTKQDLSSSIALVSIAGNDYATYLASNGTLQGLPSFTKSIIKQMATNLKRLHDLGIQKVAVSGIEPLGCLPQFTAASSYQNCSSSANSISLLHNQLLEQSITKLNNNTQGQSVFIILDLYNAFISAFQVQDNYIPPAGSFKFENPLKPCCVGVSNGYGCGNVDGSTGEKKYNVCENPELSFFWDVIHPSQQGWLAVSSALNSSLNLLFLRKHF